MFQKYLLTNHFYRRLTLRSKIILPIFFSFVAVLSIFVLSAADTYVTYGVGAYGAPYYRYEPMDVNGNKVMAHCPDIHFENGYYYWFGEAKRYQNKAYGGTNCYRSTDMQNWTFIGNVTPMQSSGPFSHDVNACSAHFMYNGSQWIMICAQCGPAPTYLDMKSVVAVSTGGITGPYYYSNDLNTTSLGGEGSIFRDDDGSTYFVYTGAGHTNGNETIDKLSSDLKSVVSRKWQSTIARREGNVILKANGRYYLIHSGMKGWAPNQHYYRTSTDLVNWSDEALFMDSKGYHSQSMSIFTVKGVSGIVYMLLCNQNFRPNEPYPPNDGLDYYVSSAYKFYPLEFANGVGGTEIHVSNTFPWTLNLTQGTWSPGIGGSKLSYPGNSID